MIHTTTKMNFIILFAIYQGSIASRIFKRLLPAQAQLPDMPYQQDAGMFFLDRVTHGFSDFQSELSKLLHLRKLLKRPSFRSLHVVNGPNQQFVK